MPRKPRDFEFEKPIDAAAFYTRAVYMKPKEFNRIKNLFTMMTERFNVRLLGFSYNEKQIRLRLYFEKNCGCNISKVMQWLLTKLARCVNRVMKSHGKVFYDRFSSKINHLLLICGNFSNRILPKNGTDSELILFCVSVPKLLDTSPPGTNYT